MSTDATESPQDLFATWFPHICDGILRHTDLASNLALRSACRALRDKVDPLLAYHIQLDAPQGDAKLGSISSKGCPRNDSSLFKLPLEPHIIDRFLPFSQVVDITYPHDRKVRTNQLPSLKTVRLFPRDDKKHDLDVGTPLGPTECILFVRLRPPRDDYGMELAQFRGYPKTSQRLVVNITLDTSHHNLLGSKLMLPICPVTLIFTKDRNPQFTADDRLARANSPGLWPVITPIEGTKGYPSHPHTFVNYEIVRRSWFGAANGDPPDATAKDILIHRLVTDMSRPRGPDRRSAVSKAEALERVAKKVRFLTLDEYREEVGEAQFLLETKR